MKPVVYHILFFISLLSFGNGIPDSQRLAISEELKAPIALVLSNSQTIEGHPINISKEEIKIASTEGAGEIIFTFNYEEIETIEIPGESYKSLAIEWMDAGKNAKALDLMDLLFQQRKALLPILPASESNFFVLYIQLILDSPNPARAVGVGRRLRPQIENTEAIRALEDATLESYQRMELFEEAVPIAKVWVKQRNPYGKSALGYYVLGSEHLRRTNYESALDLALRPIVFSSIIPTDKLDHCYALAVSAAFEMRERDYAVELYKEMQKRGFAWPKKDSTLEPYLKKIDQYITKNEKD